NVSQWCKGEYYLANNTQDDLAIIAAKINYRVDDHGNSALSATPLVITGGTNVVSTTPETDPTNSNAANKGILERNTDVDVFSFTTGNGSVNLTVRPWITPSGTKGGNLDVLLELYDSAGVLLMTNNPASFTFATVQTNLSAGTYFLHVRNSAAGDPFSSSPTGYTSYGSIGQYFINGYIASPIVVPPSAALNITDLNLPDQSSKLFTVTYTDNVAINVNTLDSNDLVVTGPSGYSNAAQFVSVDINSFGSPRVATYSALPPTGSTWLPSHNGSYSISIRSNQVSDTEGAWVPAGLLGQFEVAVPSVIYSANMDVNPGWLLEPDWQYGPPAYNGAGPVAGFTGANIIGYNLSGNYPNSLAVRYATSPDINSFGSTSLSLRFRRWLGLRAGDTAMIQVSTNGTAWTDVWSTSNVVADVSWQEMLYALPTNVVGSSSLRVRWGLASNQSQNDIGWNIDDVQILATGSVTPPATLTVGVNNSAWGSVVPTNASYPAGTVVQLTAFPADYYRFMHWSGDLVGTNNPITIVLDTNKSVHAVFGEVLTTNYPTPLWWLVQNGFTNDFDNAVSTVGSNALPLWQSYVAGLNPNDPASRFTMGIHPLQNAGGDVLHWSTVSNRYYTLWMSTNLLSGFQAVSGASALHWTVPGYTNLTPQNNGPRFYRLEVQKP
ncbi:MAG: InlB B-repeat-containing protein, partial [Limisphaerales bacterium]